MALHYNRSPRPVPPVLGPAFQFSCGKWGKVLSHGYRQHQLSGWSLPLLVVCFIRRRREPCLGHDGEGAVRRWCCKVRWSGSTRFWINMIMYLRRWAEYRDACMLFIIEVDEDPACRETGESAREMASSIAGGFGRIFKYPRGIDGYVCMGRYNASIRFGVDRMHVSMAT